jgi:hypothetical protein
LAADLELIQQARDLVARVPDGAKAAH